MLPARFLAWQSGCFLKEKKIECDRENEENHHVMYDNEHSPLKAISFYKRLQKKEGE